MQMVIIRINGTRTRLSPTDFNKDGVTGGVETINSNTGQFDVKETSELGDVMDKAFPQHATQIVNMLGNIKQFEEENIFLLRSLVRLHFLPKKCIELADEYLLLSVSRDARGRDDIRDITIGKKEMDAKTGIKEGMGNLVSGNGGK